MDKDAIKNETIDWSMNEVAVKAGHVPLPKWHCPSCHFLFDEPAKAKNELGNVFEVCPRCTSHWAHEAEASCLYATKLTYKPDSFNPPGG